MFIVHRIVLALNGIAILLLLAAYAAPFVSPELFWPVAFLGLAYPVILALNLVFILYWIVFFRIKFLFSLVAIILGYTYIPSFIQINAKKTQERENSISVMSFNLKSFGSIEAKKLEEPDKFFEILDKVDPDIMCMQEARNYGTKTELPMYRRFFKRVSEYHQVNVRKTQHGYKTADGLMIISRFPVLASGEVEHEAGSDNFTIYADILAHGDTIRVLSTHLRSIRFEEKEYAAVKSMDLEDDSTVSGYKSITQKLKSAFIRRAKQAQDIHEFILSSPHPVIVCGDFNDSPISYAYHTVGSKLKDAFKEAGSGLGRTYVGTMPSFRIDYILYDPSFTAFNYYAKAFEFSDHKMISCTLRIK